MESLISWMIFFEMNRDNVLEHIWQYLNHKSLKKAAKQLKKEASINVEENQEMLETFLSLLKPTTETPEVITAKEPKKAKKSKKGKKEPKKETLEVADDIKQVQEPKIVEQSEPDTATLVSGLAEIIKNDAEELKSQAPPAKKRKIDQISAEPQMTQNEKAIKVQ